jgi:hypothetical protein
MEVHNPQKILREQIEAKALLQRQRMGLAAALPDSVPAMQAEIRALRGELNAVKVTVNQIIEALNRRPDEPPSE